MRTNAKAFITICLLLISFTGLSQTERRYDAWEHPILKRLDRHDPYLVTFTHNDSGDYFIPLAILNKANARLYYISTLGFVFDSVSLGPVLSKELAGKRLDAFGIYTTDITAKCLNELEGIRSQIRAGKFDVNKLLARNSYLNYTELKNAISSFEQLNWLVNLENEVWQAYHMVNLDLNRRNDSVYIAKEQGFQFFDPCKIKIHGHGKVDSVEFTPCNRFTRLSSALLKPDKKTIYLFDQQNRMFDSFSVKESKIKDITEDKEDVFAIYQLWLEWQWEKLTKEWNKLVPQKPARFDPRLLGKEKLRRLDTLARAAWVVEQKMWYATMPDKDLVLVSLAEKCKAVPRKKWIKAEKRWSDFILEADLSAGVITTFTRGRKEYFLTDHRENVMVTVTDKKIQVDSNHDGKVDYYVADVVTATDYAPFGALLPGRTFRNKGQQLKYGYNGKENDNEIKGEGNQQDYGMRIYDPRLGRFLSVDPLTKSYPMLTPYQFASNTPISAIDIDGEEALIVVDKKAKEVQINFKFTYSEAELKVLTERNITLNDIRNSFDYYYKPGKDGNTQATKDAMANTQLSKEQLEEKLGGKIADGGDGYFNVDKGAEGTYKVFFNLEIDNTLKPQRGKKENGVFEMEFQKTLKRNEPNVQGAWGITMMINDLASSKSVGKDASHEIGHQGGLPDYYSYLKENPFKNRNANVKVKEDGLMKEYSVGEIMDNLGSFRVLSLGSIERIISIPLSTAQTVPENKVTLLSGSVNQPNDNTQPSNNSPAKILKKED